MTRYRSASSLICLAIVLGLVSACSSTGSVKSGQRSGGGTAGGRGGGYFSNDGPPSRIPVDLDKVVEPEPQVEPLLNATMRPYNVFGQSFSPQRDLDTPYQQRGMASWYGKKFHGEKTASGEPYNMFAMTAAHPTLPIPSYAQVTLLSTGQSVVVRINDRGPFLRGRIIDLSYVAAHRLGLLGAGSAEVEVLKFTPTLIAQRQQEKNQPMLANANADAYVDTAASTATRSATITTAGLVTSAATSEDDDPLMRFLQIHLAATESVPDRTPPLRAAGLSTATQSPSLHLQLGAFTSRAQADRLHQQAKAQAPLHASLFKVVFRDGFHKVLAGPFASRDEAQPLYNQVRQRLAVTPSWMEWMVH